MQHPFDDFSHVREGVRALCSTVSAEYWREIDEQRGRLACKRPQEWAWWGV